MKNKNSNGQIAQKNIGQGAISIINNSKQVLDSCSSLYRPTESVVISDVDTSSPLSLRSSFEEVSDGVDKKADRGRDITWARMTLFEPVPNQFSMNLYLNYDLVKNKPRSRMTFSFKSTRLRDFLPRGAMEKYRNEPFYRGFLDEIKKFSLAGADNFELKPRVSKAYLSGKTAAGGTQTIKYTAASIWKFKDSDDYEVNVWIGKEWRHSAVLARDELTERQIETYAVGEYIFRSTQTTDEWIDVGDLL